MPEERKSFYEARVASGKTTFFIDAKQAVNGRYYLSITESRRTESDTFEQRRVIVFEEGIQQFREALNEAFISVEKLVSHRPEGEVVEVRDQHPKAFTKWSPADEQELEREYRKNPSIPSVAEKTGRTEKAVQARLEKMGLIPPEKTAVS
jgi:hypothetical protein